MLGVEEKGETPKPKAPPKPKKPAPAGNITDAAQAVADAVRADTGREKKVDNWKPVASKVLGLKRLHPKRWEAILKAGTDAGLFEINTSGKYPVLLIPDPSPEPKTPTQEPPKKTLSNSPHPNPPKDWNPPKVLDCGHMSFSSEKEEAHAKEAGHCCANHKGSIHWTYLKGEYLRTIPMKYRRTKEKAEGTGYPGLCCDEDGFYQGGTANCALYDNPKATPCEGCHLRGRQEKS